MELTTYGMNNFVDNKHDNTNWWNLKPNNIGTDNCESFQKAGIEYRDVIGHTKVIGFTTLE